MKAQLRQVIRARRPREHSGLTAQHAVAATELYKASSKYKTRDSPPAIRSHSQFRFAFIYSFRSFFLALIRNFRVQLELLDDFFRSIIQIGNHSL